MQAFFPGPLFGWFYCAALIALLAVACYSDLRWILLPNWLVILIAVVGFVANSVRGILLGIQGRDVWILPAGLTAGGFDGILFSLAGLIAGLALGIPLFATGIAGGGDGKLIAAVGAWSGPSMVLWILFAASVIMLLFLAVRVLLVALSQGREGMSGLHRRPDDPRGAAAFPRLMTFSPALLVAAAAVVGWNHREELKIETGTAVQLQITLRG